MFIIEDDYICYINASLILMVCNCYQQIFSTYIVRYIGNENFVVTRVTIMYRTMAYIELSKIRIKPYVIMPFTVQIQCNFC